MDDIYKTIRLCNLQKPYDALSHAFDLDTIIDIAENLKGLEINFAKKNCQNTNDYKLLIDLFGTEITDTLYKIYRGDRVYFADIKRTCDIGRLIKKEYTGYNARELSRKYKYSERHIKRIVNEVKVNNDHMDGQVSLDEYLNKASIFMTMSLAKGKSQ